MDFDKIDLGSTTIEEIENLFSQRIVGHTRPSINISFEGVFRTRIVDRETDLSTTKSIWFPDFSELEEKCYRFNRCSDKGQNFLYTSNSLETAIKELNPRNENLVLIGVFGLKNETAKVRSQFAGIEVLKNVSDHKVDLRNYKYEAKTDQIIEEYMSNYFQTNVEDDNNKYKLSIAFSNILLKNTEIKCIIYPSVASNLESVNYGFKPEFVDESMYCKQIHLYKIEKTETQFVLVPEQYGNISFDTDKSKHSKIKWLECTDEHKTQILVYSTNRMI